MPLAPFSKNRILSPTKKIPNLTQFSIKTQTNKHSAISQNVRNSSNTQHQLGLYSLLWISSVISV